MRKVCVLNQEALEVAGQLINIEIGKYKKTLMEDLQSLANNLAAKGQYRSGNAVKQGCEIYSNHITKAADFALTQTKKELDKTGVAYFEGIGDQLKEFVVKFIPSNQGEMIKGRCPLYGNEVSREYIPKAINETYKSSKQETRAKIDSYVLGLKYSKSIKLIENIRLVALEEDSIEKEDRLKLLEITEQATAELAKPKPSFDKIKNIFKPGMYIINNYEKVIKFFNDLGSLFDKSS